MGRQHWLWMMAGTGFWTVAVGLAVFATVTESIRAAMWAVLATQGACLVTGLIVIDVALCRRKARVEIIAEAAAREVMNVHGRLREVPK